MTSVLVSGKQVLVSRLGEALRDAGAEVTEVSDLADLPKVCTAAGDGAFDAYVQLPATFPLEGDSVIERVRSYYANGVLGRFPALHAVLPSLRPGARATLVLGQLAAEVTSPDDQEARLALTRVLAHAARADSPHGGLSVRILPHDTSLDDLVAAALGQEAAPQPDLDDLSDLDYADWRVEVLGLANRDT